MSETSDLVPNCWSCPLKFQHNSGNLTSTSMKPTLLSSPEASGACDPPWSESIRPLRATLQKGADLQQLLQVLLIFPHARIKRINQDGELLY